MKDFEIYGQKNIKIGEFPDVQGSRRLRN